MTANAELVAEVLSHMENPTVGNLVNRLITDHGLTFKEATRLVYSMSQKSALEFSEVGQPSTFLEYTVNTQSLWFWILTAVVMMTTLTAFYAVDPPFVYLRYVLASLLVLYLPGSMLTEALYPKNRELDFLERIALSIGLSLAIVPILGLVLNYTPWGLRLAPIAVSLAVFVEGMAIATIARRYRYYLLAKSGK